MRAGGFPGNPGGLVVSILKTAGARAPAHQARGRGRRTWRPTERTAGARMVPPGEGNEARGDGRRGVGVSHSTAEAGELSPRDPVEGRGHRQVAPLEGKTANTPRLGPVSTSRQRIAELARHAVGMAVAIAWLPGPAGTRRRVAKLSVEEPDAAEPARPDLWGARVSNDPGLPDPCRTSCPDCLRDFSNLPYHPILDWRLGLDVARLTLDPSAPVGFTVSYWQGLDAAVAGLYFAAMPGWQQMTIAGLQAGSRGNVVEIITHPLWDTDPKRFGPQLAAAHAQAVATGNQVRFKSLFEVLRRPF